LRGPACQTPLTNDLNGQALRRDEADYNYSTGDPHEVWYRFGGRQLGYNGNNGTIETSYHTSIENRQKLSNNNGTGTTGAFRWGGVNGAGHADFDQSVGRINSYGQGSSGGMHSVREGDTLQSIAAQLWGDSSLWYKLAEANGMSAANALVEGQSLVVPAGVSRSSHNASTLKPYDPSEIAGDLSPSATAKSLAARPPRRNHCGMFGQILLVAVAVAVTALVAGPAGGLVGS
jgi:LysM repeat protein